MSIYRVTYIRNGLEIFIYINLLISNPFNCQLIILFLGYFYSDNLIKVLFVRIVVDIH